MGKFTVNTDQLNSSGDQLMQIAASYQSAYRALLEAAKNTQQGWKAEDNDAFVTKVTGLEDDYSKAYQTIYGAGKDLKDSAQKYLTSMNNNKSKANALKADF